MLLEDDKSRKEYTFIHNWQMQPFHQDYGLASQTTYVACIEFICKCWYLLFSVDSELRIFARYLLRGNRRRNFFHISFGCLPWYTNANITSNKPLHYLLDYCDYIFLPNLFCFSQDFIKLFVPLFNIKWLFLEIKKIFVSLSHIWDLGNNPEIISE